MPRRSTATIGLVFRTSAPPRDSHTGSCADDGRSVPVVITSGPASAGVAADLARTTPMLSVPVAPLIGVEVGVVGGAVQRHARDGGDGGLR